MRRYLTYLILILASTQVFAQRIHTDIFGNLIHESGRGNYEAKLEVNIFDDIVFTDNRENEITYKSAYIKKEYRALLDHPEEKYDLFRHLIMKYRNDANYEATYEVDIFDNVNIEDNRDLKVEYGEDIFGNESYYEEIDGKKVSIKRNLRGGLEYETNTEEAELNKDIFDNWIYEDSRGNEITLSRRNWNRLIRRYGTDEKIFFSLIDEYLYDHHDHRRRN